MTWNITAEEQERTVVGGILVHSRAFDQVAGELEPSDFSVRPLGAVWETMLSLDRDQEPIDAVSVWQRMKALGTDGTLRHDGGEEYLVRLMSEVVTVENIEYHAKAVADLAERRRWAQRLRALSAEANDQSTDSASFFKSVESTVLELMQQRRTVNTMVDSNKGMRALVAELEKRYAEKDKKDARGVPTGFRGFDYITSGLRPGQVVVIAARPNVGKSAWAGCVMENCARAGIPSLCFSVEMGNEEYWERMVAANGVPSDRLRTGNLTTEDFKSMSKTASDLASPPRMTIDDTGELTILEMRTRARRWRARSGAGANALIVIDYLQLVRSGRKGDQPREQEVAEVSRSIKIMAKELKVPVIALAQLNREVEKRQNKRPGIADLRESGQIEQDADIVGFLYREEIADPSCEEAKKGTAELIVAKGRGIPRGTIHLLFDKEHTRFRNRPPRVKTAGQGNTYQEDNDVED